MPAKIADDEKIPKIPNLDVAQWKFFLKSHPNCKKTEEKLIAEIKAKGNLSNRTFVISDRFILFFVVITTQLISK